MKKRAHHRELQLSNYHVCNFQFKTYFGSCVWGGGGGGGFVWVPGYKVFAENFHLFLCVFTFSVFQTLLYIGTNVWQQSNWLKNELTAPIEAFHVEKSPNLKVDKSFAGEIFLCVKRRIFFFGQGSEEMSKEYACKVSRRCHFRTWSFFQKKVTQRWWTDILLPQRFSLAALLRITCCCYGFMACPRDPMAIQLFAAQKVGHLSLSPRRGPMHDRDVDVHIGRKSVFLASKALVTSFLTTSFYVIFLSSLLSA